MSERVIIGETERAGWPISQPVHSLAITSLPVRFVAHNDKCYFTLEAWSDEQQQWLEVPVFNSTERRREA